MELSSSCLLRGIVKFQSAQSLQISILNHNYTVQNHAAEKSYYESNLEYQKTLLDAGLCSQDDVNDASKQVEWAGVTEITDQVDGLLLQIQIEQLNLQIKEQCDER